MNAFKNKSLRVSGQYFNIKKIIFISMLTTLAMIFMFTGIVTPHTVNAAEEYAAEAAPTPDCTFLGIEGKYITQIQEALDRINEIRLEACSEGVENPATGKPLTPDDYIPLKWSSDLEYIARIRAAEASVTIAHKRTNGGSIWFSGPTNGVNSNSEVIAWNWTETMTSGVNQWYAEKSAWVNNTGGVTGHYTSMINPTKRYVGLASFCSDTTKYYNTTVGEFSSSTNALDTSRGDPTGTIIQIIEVKNDHITYEIDCKDYNIQDSDKISVSAKVTFKDNWGSSVITHGLILPEDLTKGIQWSSSDSDLIYVSNGQIKIKSCGSVTITATLQNGSTAKKDIFVEHDYEETVTPATCKGEGKIVKKCKICGNTVTETIPKTNQHDYETTTTPATCKDEGRIVKKCKVCGNTVTETIPKTNQHDYETTTTPATCKDEGKIVKKCKVCGNTVTETIPNTNQHSFGDWVVTKVPTAAEDGTETRTCTVCGIVETKTLRYEPSGTEDPPTTSADVTPETSPESTSDSSDTSTTETSDTSTTETSEPSDTETSEPSDTETSEPQGTETSEPSSSDSSQQVSTPDKTDNDTSGNSHNSTGGSGSAPSDIWIPIAAASGITLAAFIAIICLCIKRKK